MRINLFRLRANRFFSQGNSFQCRFSTASSSVKGIEFVGEAVESENLFFPWRKRPESDSYRGTLVAKLLLNQIQSEIDFLNGSLMAFQESVRSIFLHRDMVQHNTHINARFSEKLPLIDENYQSLPLEEVFEDRLAKFYANAVKNILLESECKVFYSLSSLNRSEIVRSDLLLYSEVDKVEHEFLERDNTNFGLGILRPQSREGVTPSDEEKINGNPIIDNIITNLKSSKDLSVNEPDSLLLRIWVDIHCKGLHSSCKDFLTNHYLRNILCEKCSVGSDYARV